MLALPSEKVKAIGSGHDLTGEDLSLEAGFVAWRRGSSGWSRGADEDYGWRDSGVIQAEPDPNVSGIAVALSGDTQ
jgi:hypothetical protein